MSDHILARIDQRIVAVKTEIAQLRRARGALTGRIETADMIEPGHSAADVIRRLEACGLFE